MIAFKWKRSRCGMNPVALLRSEVNCLPDDEIMSPVHDLFMDITSSKIDAEELPRTVKL